MPLEKLITALKAAQSIYSDELAKHATARQPTTFQQELQDRLFTAYEWVTAWLDTLL